jgi:subtilisin-like proprotein convertase family protein
VDISHTYRGDLVVIVHPPEAMSVGPITLLDRTGGGSDNVKQAWDSSNAPGLAQLIGKEPAGTWELEVRDEATQDVGVLRSWGIELTM